MAREDTYKQQLTDLGVYDPSHDSLIHDLCIAERERSRLRKELKAAEKSTEPRDELRKIRREIMDHDKLILKYQTELCLTPRAIQSRRTSGTSESAASLSGTANPSFASAIDRLWEDTHAG